tara:strand:- start:15875 stop:16048 length:174 start_codon:yes stop_codon:yes gene_type:complete
MKDFKEGLSKGMNKPGKLEYVFGLLGVICVMPIALVYFALVNFIFKPLYWFKGLIWK